MMDFKLLTQKEAAKTLRVSLSGLDTLRRKDGLPFVKLGSRVYYREEDINEFIDNNRVVFVKEGN